MLSLFRPRLPIDDDELEFQLATFKWLGEQFGPVSADTPRIEPTTDWFAARYPPGAAGVEALFDEVRAAAGMSDWPCALEAGDATRSSDAGNAHLLKHEGDEPPCGTFELREEDGVRTAVVTYNPAMMAAPDELAATFAHELGHYLLATANDPPPGGWDLHELHTDLAAVYLGFGLFMANSAKTFRLIDVAGGSGWQMSRQGYLTEGALVTAFAIVERLAGRDALAARIYLKDYLRKDLAGAVKALAKRHPDMTAAVAAVDLAEFA